MAWVRRTVAVAREPRLDAACEYLFISDLSAVNEIFYKGNTLLKIGNFFWLFFIAEHDGRHSASPRIRLMRFLA